MNFGTFKDFDGGALLAEIAPNVSNATLGKVATVFVAAGAMDAERFGSSLRTALDSVAPAPTKGEVLPDSPLLRKNLLDTIYEALSGNFRRRSVNALSRSTGLAPDAVLKLVSDNSDFLVSKGRNTGRDFVSLASL